MTTCARQIDTPPSGLPYCDGKRENNLYDLAQISQNLEKVTGQKTVIASADIRALGASVTPTKSGQL